MMIKGNPVACTEVKGIAGEEHVADKDDLVTGDQGVERESCAIRRHKLGQLPKVR